MFGFGAPLQFERKETAMSRRSLIQPFVFGLALVAPFAPDARSAAVQEDAVVSAPLPAAVERAPTVRTAQFGGFSIEIPMGPPDDDGPSYGGQGYDDDDEPQVRAPRRPKRVSCEQYVRQERDALRAGNERAADAARARHRRCTRGR